MINRVHSATVLVSDQDAAVDFYVNKLGWSKATDYEMGPGMRFITVTPGNNSAEISLASTSWMPEGWGRIGGQTGIGLTSKDVDETCRVLSERGVRFKGPVEDAPWGGRVAWFYDQDDNEFILATEVIQ